MSRPSALLRKVYPLAFSTPRRLRIALNLFPPLGASGIHIREVADDWSYARITLRLRWWNKNMHGAAFGGTLFSMTDAFFGTLVMNRLGPDYEAWTRTGTFQYLNPGRTGDTLHVSVPDELIAQIRTEVDEDGFCNIPHTSVITAPDGTTVGIGQQDLHVRKKRSREARRSSEQRAQFQHSVARPPTDALRRRDPRGVALASIATAVAWRAFGDDPGKLASITSHQRRIAEPEEQARYVCREALAAGAVTADELNTLRIPRKVLDSIIF
ncbi:PaaI family thioesterase [Corynebacterium falsenii]|uniref:PaaI family thioesterase n=1 Tax=Corynebacterium falsenii TaxID=108486 RepID=UPI003FD04D03